MNREIIFRGKSTNNGKWVYAKLHGFGMDLFNECVQENTIGQFTGLFDKNGKEIYEGDIVEQIVTNGYGYGFIGEVSFDNGVFGIKHKTYKGYIVSRFVYSSDWNDGHAHGTILYEYELKGNIFDNPELLTNYQ
ncbi:YopX family protein [Bacteroides fragilis]